MANKECGFRQTINEIETIISKIENNETDLDDLPAEIARASKLLQDCRDKLFKTEQEVSKIVNHE